MRGYKWVRFKGARWEIVYIFGEELMLMNRSGFISTKLIVEFGPNIHKPNHLIYTMDQQKMGYPRDYWKYDE